MLAGAVDELNKYPLAIGKRWGLWNDRTRPGEGAMIASLMRTENAPKRLAQLTTVRLGRYRRPFYAGREADWIAAAVDLESVDMILTGMGGMPGLDDLYAAVTTALAGRMGRPLERQTYKQMCGEFHSASAFGFSMAVELVQNGRRGVLLYTLAARGGKAICCIQP